SVVLPLTEVVVKEVPAAIAEDVVQRRPRGLLLERRVEELLDPGRVEVLDRLAPRRAHAPRGAPDAPLVGRGIGLDDDLAARGDRAVPAAGALEHRAISAHLRRGDLAVPPERRRPVALLGDRDGAPG